MQPASAIALVSLLALMLVPVTAEAQQRSEAQLAARCSTLAGAANRYRGGRSESSFGPSSIVVGAQLDCQKGRYDKGIAALEKYLRDQRIPLPPG